MREFELIQALRQQTPSAGDVMVGPGDDCAVVQLGGAEVLLKVDACLEGRHFVRAGQGIAGLELEMIGRKALARCLSDIAAMGGVPKFALVAAQLPTGMTQDEALRINAGLRELADAAGVSIVGGETTLSMAGIGLTITLVGEMSGLKPVLRSGAREGEVILVTGGFGGSILGKHASFEPRLAEGRWLAEVGATSMIDVSDGLANDLAHLCRESGCGATINQEMIPVAEAAHSLAERDKQSALEHALHDGEDFELIATMPEALWQKIHQDWPFATKLNRIGQMTAPKPHLIDICGPDANPNPLALRGFEHTF